MSFSYIPFKSVDLSDPFFDSLKQDYLEFGAWFAKKAENMAYVSVNPLGQIDGFLYLKFEDEALTDISPAAPAKKRLKVGTFKIVAHGTKLGDRFVKKLFDHAMGGKVEEIYVTVFAKHGPLIRLLSKHGFRQTAEKHTPNGAELVLSRVLKWQGESLLENYPLVQLAAGRKYLLALLPKWHTRLLPDSKLATEGPDVVADVSHANSIQKIYLAGLSGAEGLKRNDILVIYRTTDDQAPAHYRSVATSVCVVERVKMIGEFGSEEEFVTYCIQFSVFTEDELRGLYTSRKYPVLITFTYNISLPKRITRKVLIEEVGLDGKERWAFLPLSDDQFRDILQRGQVDANFIVD